jgi:hypothetical protein
MTSTNTYKVNSPNIIHETIDDEVVIVDLENGFYYSLRGTAAQIWARIIGGFSEPDIIKYLSVQYNIDQARIEKSIKDFIHQLVEENIIHQTAPANMGDAPDRSEPQLINLTKIVEFKTPVIEKFTDMSELLLLDPIHEVDETGWPNMAPDNITDEEK